MRQTTKHPDEKEETSIEIPYVPVRAVATGPVEWTTTFLLRYEEPVTIPETTIPCP
jgi:hypothetical protein